MTAPAHPPTSILDRLVAAGRLGRGHGNLVDLLMSQPAEPGEKSLSETLREPRDEERW
ncbi:MAG TPA: hypothetical protein VD813_09240 [Pseudonocardia sp.]|nr:hypothetical protein [Pseudonocardia sp.]